ncbi:MAG TPA: c-type cytochrome [Caulobacterales bacterium]|nr:c-type cytochrome [Caulobacterales bacterium]
MRKLWLLVASLALAACAETPAPTPQEALISDGRDIAEAECAGCHSIGAYGESPNPQAPTFRTVLSRYHAEVLEEELIEGVRVAHPMPEFQFNPQGADALIAYLKSIQAPAEAPPS